MIQAIMFEGVKVRQAKVGSRQGAFKFGGFTESGRRGDMHAGWLDAVLTSLRLAGAPVPTLVELQAQWDNRASAAEAARALIRASNPPEPAPENVSNWRQNG